MADFGPRAPHGPDMSGTHNPLEDMDMNEKGAFDSLIRPDDSYTPEGTYWADLPLWKKISFVTSSNNVEAKKEMNDIWAMLKKDPLSPISYYFRNMVLPGAGLGLEGYVLFSIGNIKPLFEKTFPDCWKHHTTCSQQWIYAIDYLEIIGIIVGQILVGILGDWLGRRWGLIQDAVIMLLGLVMLTAAWGVTMNGWVICYAWCLFIYGIGVGGEYPMTATSGMENAVGSGKVSTKDDRLHRGRKVTSAFLMQGWGQFFNQVLLIILLLCFHHGSGNNPYSAVAVQWTYRVSFAIPAVGTLWLVYYRAYHMKAASKQLAAAKKKASVTGYDAKSLKLTFKYFGFRIFATAGGWFANDVFFYGNKLFQSEFIKVISPASESVMPTWLWNLVNVGVSLCGYYLASFLIDNKLYGRKWMQIIGFMLCFILFIVPAFNFEYYRRPENIKSFQTMYFLSSFFNQFGPNSVSFLVAAEVFPTPIRASAHGMSAAWGKAGALLAAVLYNYIDTQTKFYVVPWFGLAGAVITAFFLPDTTGLDLKEQERRWQYLRSGREEEYHGPAVHPKHLSWYERYVLRKHRFYNAELDYQQKVEEYRIEWETAMAAKSAEKDAADAIDTDDSLLEGHVHTYFHRTSPMFKGMEKNVSAKQDTFTLPPPAESEAEDAYSNEKH
ncbi:Major facilitator superfamily domain, general substrate transporter [Penicillium griseofulvum]|uniref:Major facilitator superfamily domain, general substrate transporter n=1 Tax=Penicillium patulum TaxID=5078 RepID=A0A135LYT0_PENPA|nr:Major facilitator superfamily domain, general substrate transporter [Penicillium griseofulvum]KXG54118.1 Major facilitator superfamily domain, general substrate transporter [Penicillium griseofulvum]